MDFYHDKLKSFIPTEIKISGEEYNKMMKCESCLEDSKKYGINKYYRETFKYKLEDDIYFDCYYWIIKNSKDNVYAYNDSLYYLYNLYELIDLDSSFSKFKMELLLTIYINDIPMDSLVKLCTYHSIWLHKYYHCMYKIKGLYLDEMDNMSQPDHVNSKNCLNFMIGLKLSSRQMLMEDIREFSLLPPMKENGIYGYEYKQSLDNFEENVKVLSNNN